MARQYTGTAGKVTNCQAGVSLHPASDSASAAVGWRLFLPESWDQPRPRPIRARWPAERRAVFPKRSVMSRSCSWPWT
ncbi:transposase [Streptomyces sp. NPDC001139]